MSSYLSLIGGKKYFEEVTGACDPYLPSEHGVSSKIGTYFGNELIMVLYVVAWMYRKDVTIVSKKLSPCWAKPTLANYDGA